MSSYSPARDGDMTFTASRMGNHNGQPGVWLRASDGSQRFVGKNAGGKAGALYDKYKKAVTASDPEAVAEPAAPVDTTVDAADMEAVSADMDKTSAEFMPPKMAPLPPPAAPAAPVAAAAPVAQKPLTMTNRTTSIGGKSPEWSPIVDESVSKTAMPAPAGAGEPMSPWAAGAPVSSMPPVGQATPAPQAAMGPAAPPAAPAPIQMRPRRAPLTAQTAMAIQKDATPESYKAFMKGDRNPALLKIKPPAKGKFPAAEMLERGRSLDRGAKKIETLQTQLAKFSNMWTSTDKKLKMRELDIAQKEQAYNQAMYNQKLNYNERAQAKGGKKAMPNAKGQGAKGQGAGQIMTDPAARKQYVDDLSDMLANPKSQEELEGAMDSLDKRINDPSPENAALIVEIYKKATGKDIFDLLATEGKVNPKSAWGKRPEGKVNPKSAWGKRPDQGKKRKPIFGKYGDVGGVNPRSNANYGGRTKESVESLTYLVRNDMMKEMDIPPAMGEGFLKREYEKKNGKGSYDTEFYGRLFKEFPPEYLKGKMKEFRSSYDLPETGKMTKVLRKRIRERGKK